MIYIRLAGGLGNQLFQLAAGLEIQETTKLPIVIFTNALSEYSTKRKPSILKIIELSDSFVLPKRKSWQTFLLSKRIGKLNLPSICPFCVNNETISKLKKSMAFYLVDDYFQDISKIPNGLKKAVSIIEQKTYNEPVVNQVFSSLINDEYNQQSTIALHIRRGDYLSEQYKSIYPTLGEEYYKAALEKFGNKIKQLVIFSDDPLISFNFFQDYKTSRISEFELDDVQEFLLMSKFKNMIIANSTYSFWGAVTNSYLKKIKIASSKWSTKETENQIWKNNFELGNFITL